MARDGGALAPLPDLTRELVLMTDDITSARDRPVRRRFTQLVDALESARARYAIVGAVAMGAYGVRRYTEDIDVLVAEEDLGPVLAALAPALAEVGREPAEGPPKQVRLRSKRARGSGSVDVDLLVPVDFVEAWALASAVRGLAFGRAIDVASAEALIVMKLQAFLDDPTSHAGGKHRSDAMQLLLAAGVDVDSLRAFVRTNAALAAELERVLAAPPPRGRVR